jgi:hypothetical protein
MKIMKTIQLNLYPFNELAEAAKAKVLIKHADINLTYEWWSFIYEDAMSIGLAIYGFELDRDYCCNAAFIQDASYSAALIIATFGEHTDTYQIARTFQKERERIVTEWPRDENRDLMDGRGLDNLLEALDGAFFKAMTAIYLRLLLDCYNDLTGKESIMETITDNHYYFTADGQLATRLETLAGTQRTFYL